MSPTDLDYVYYDRLEIPVVTYQANMREALVKMNELNCGFCIVKMLLKSLWSFYRWRSAPQTGCYEYQLYCFDVN